ncbi:MAG TPA: alpha/beta hydrolase [Conexibacter sp.]|jgi:acetyl esterase|nr:alpha/beta hydrolase [Conexibacter sp.]
MPLGSQSQKVNELLKAKGLDLTQPIEQLRAQITRNQEAFAGPSPSVAEVRDLALPGPAGIVAARAYRPEDERPSGVLVWLHGGGFAFGSLDESDAVARALARACDCLVVAVDYRLAPEHPFPAGVEDCYAAVRWVAEHLQELDAAGLPVAVGGDSAGGSLAAATALMARDRGGPELALQLLVYPMTCCAPLELESRRAHAEGLFATLAAIEWLWETYLDGADGTHPLASPLLAESLAGLPPALVVTAEYDVLCDEGERYASRLVAAGVPVTVRRWLGVLHGFLQQGAYVDEAVEGVAWIGAEVRPALAGVAAGDPV